MKLPLVSSKIIVHPKITYFNFPKDGAYSGFTWAHRKLEPFMLLDT